MRSAKGSSSLAGFLRALRASVSVISALCILLFPSPSLAQTGTYKPEWCKKLPHPENAALGRVLPAETWFEVYKVAPGVFAIYEPHQSEEVISYLILGRKRALLFDTGMGISDIKKLAAELTALPVAVVNSHTHNDHVGDNWRFSEKKDANARYDRDLRMAAHVASARTASTTRGQGKRIPRR